MGDEKNARIQRTSDFVNGQLKWKTDGTTKVQTHTGQKILHVLGTTGTLLQAAGATAKGIHTIASIFNHPEWLTTTEARHARFQFSDLIATEAVAPLSSTSTAHWNNLQLFIGNWGPDQRTLMQNHYHTIYDNMQSRGRAQRYSKEAVMAYNAALKVLLARACILTRNYALYQQSSSENPALRQMVMYATNTLPSTVTGATLVAKEALINIWTALAGLPMVTDDFKSIAWRFSNVFRMQDYQDADMTICSISEINQDVPWTTEFRVPTDETEVVPIGSHRFRLSSIETHYGTAGSFATAIMNLDQDITDFTNHYGKSQITKDLKACFMTHTANICSSAIEFLNQPTAIVTTVYDDYIVKQIKNARLVTGSSDLYDMASSKRVAYSIVPTLMLGAEGTYSIRFITNHVTEDDGNVDNFSPLMYQYMITAKCGDQTLDVGDVSIENRGECLSASRLAPLYKDGLTLGWAGLYPSHHAGEVPIFMASYRYNARTGEIQVYDVQGSRVVQAVPASVNENEIKGTTLTNPNAIWSLAANATRANYPEINLITLGSDEATSDIMTINAGVNRVSDPASVAVVRLNSCVTSLNSVKVKEKDRNTNVDGQK